MVKNYSYSYDFAKLNEKKGHFSFQKVHFITSNNFITSNKSILTKNACLCSFEQCERDRRTENGRTEAAAPALNSGLDFSHSWPATKTHTHLLHTHSIVGIHTPLLDIASRKIRILHHFGMAPQLVYHIPTYILLVVFFALKTNINNPS